MSFHSLPPRFRRRALGAVVFSSALVLAACGGDDDKSSRLPEAGTAQLVVLETTDLHANLLSYDYFKLAEDKSVGFERT
ncbi:MAG TPA: hypothetical protein PLV36_16070, partial [Zoogloea sp.]|nr:hypothetical protein [Zoogloea sp.]